MSFLRKPLSPESAEDYTNTPENILTEYEFEDGEFEFVKKITISNTRYLITFQHEKRHADGQFALHFGLDGVSGDPITNAGLDVFGKIADEMSTMYEEIQKSKEISTIYINASTDTFSRDDLHKVKEIIATDVSKLNNLMFVNQEKDFEVSFENGVAKVVVDIYGKNENSPPPYMIPITPSIVEDIKHIANVDIAYFVPDILNQINGSEQESKKQIQRLKLYQFYFQKRFPNFTFNSKVIVDENGKRTLEFEKDEDGNQYLLVNTNNKPVDTGK
jgi:hypothetical protein